MSEPSPLAAAQQRFADAVPFRSAGAEACLLTAALGRTLYKEVLAPTDLPPYHRVIVEGFIVRSEDTAGASDESPVDFTITGNVKPGDEQCPAPAQGQALEVVTGVVAPDGPYAVVRMWEAKREGDRFTVTRPFPPRFFIEEQGCDLKQGAVVAAAGTAIGPAELGNIAALGITEVQVSKRPRVAVMACGDEVIPYDQPLRPGLIRDSNTVMLSAAVTEAGGEPRAVGILRDDIDAFVAAAREALHDADMLLVSGGTAAGGGDFISNVVRELGELRVDGVPMRSGRPLIMGVADGKPLVCVAGHPPEALRGFRLFGVAAINRLMGRQAPLPEEP